MSPKNLNKNLQYFSVVKLEGEDMEWCTSALASFQESWGQNVLFLI